MSSTPSLTEFNPNLVPYQFKVIKDIRQNFDYSYGFHEILLSGSVGSAKSILIAHLAVTHCLQNKGSRFCIGRKSMPDLKDTIFTKILEHLDDDNLIEGEDYIINLSKSSIKFPKNNSEIISRSWADKKFKKFRSIELSALAIEELTENDNEYKDFYTEAIARVGRLPNVKECFVICATNPDSPSHWAHDHFIKNQGPRRHVYYSVTTDNPFLPDWYIKQLESIYDPKMARRMLKGEWLSITQDVVYHQYDSEVHFKKDEQFKIIPGLPIHIAWDFNIGKNKPMSLCLFQFDGFIFHFFGEIVIEGQRTEDSLNELHLRGWLNYRNPYIVNGDATGRHSDTRSNRSDYDIIEKYLANYKNQYGPLRFKIDVPRKNPDLRERHNTVNGYMRNSVGQVRMALYKGTETLDKGFSLTQLKKGGKYIEDDSDPWQHITTAAGYGIMSTLEAGNVQTSCTGSY